jgi:hypothetical protein
MIPVSTHIACEDFSNQLGYSVLPPPPPNILCVNDLRISRYWNSFDTKPTASSLLTQITVAPSSGTYTYIYSTTSSAQATIYRLIFFRTRKETYLSRLTTGRFIQRKLQIQKTPENSSETCPVTHMAAENTFQTIYFSNIVIP